MNIVPQQEQQVSAENREPQSRSFVAPLVDIVSTQEEYVLHAEMPGVNKEGIEVRVENGDLVITGHRRPLEISGELVHRESLSKDFRRVYELDPSIDTSRITARIENGVLTVYLPKAESVKPRRIEVN